MNNYIDQQLNKVLLLNKERNQVIKRIRNIKTKRIGGRIFNISVEEQERRVTKARKLYDSKINAVYIKMNQELKKAGMEELENPYQDKEGDN